MWQISQHMSSTLPRKSMFMIDIIYCWCLIDPTLIQESNTGWASEETYARHCTLLHQRYIIQNMPQLTPQPRHIETGNTKKQLSARAYLPIIAQKYIPSLYIATKIWTWYPTINCLMSLSVTYTSMYLPYFHIIFTNKIFLL